MKRVFLLLVLGVAFASPAVAQATPVNLSPPTISGLPQIGGRLLCNPGTWGTTESGGHTSVQFYSWFLSTDLTDPVATSGRNRFRVPSFEEGKQLVCRVTMRDTKDRTTATADSAPSAVIVGVPSVTITAFSNVVSGNVAQPLAGVTVTTNLVRDATTIGSATAITDSSGSWRATLGPSTPGPVHGFDPADSLVVNYAPPSADPDASVPPAATYTSSTFPTATISADGSSIQLSGSVECQRMRAVINGTSTKPLSPGCVVTPASPVTDNDDVRVQESTSLDQSGALSVARLRARAGLTGGPSSAPICNANLVVGAVTCRSLNSGSFAISLNGGSDVPLTKSGSVGTATLVRLKPSDLVTLEETSPTPTTRHLATLHVVRLRANLTAGTFTSGTCQPGEPFPGQFSFTVMCPSSGVTPSASNPLALTDDRSGGQVTLTIPSLTDMIPTQNATLASGPFTSFVDLAGNVSSDQLLAETQAVHLTIRPRGSQTPLVSRNMTPGSDSDGAFESVRVTGLTAGRYFADWVLRDINGDTNTYEAEFAIQG